MKFLLLALLFIPLRGIAQGSPDPTMQNVMAKIQARNYVGAVEDCNRAIAGGRGPNLYMYYVNRGIAKAHLRDIPGARNDYDRAIALKPDAEDAFLQRALLFRQMNMNDSALFDFSQAIHINSRNSATYEQRAELNFDMHKYPDALSDYDQAILRDPQNVILYGKRGRLKYLLRDFDAAIEDYTRALQIQPEGGEWYFFRGLCKSLKTPSEFVADACYDFNKAKEMGYNLERTGVDNYCDFDHYER
ncbi:MAG: tetratricopeptide repeat protein [Bacteroidota bacterium]